MSPIVFATFSEILSKRMQFSDSRSVLEIGAGAQTLLSLPVLERARKVALNLRFNARSRSGKPVDVVIGNSNAMAFPDESFDCVLSCSVMEHDQRFWRSIVEIKRILKRGGLFVVGVPIFMTLPTDYRHTTLTYARHGVNYNADFYRFSEQTVREVFFEGYTAISDEVVVRRYPNPYLVAAGRK
ncbi:MAG: class I SAM-dependent methyltransferase [Nitrospira sp.]|nr:class I SAM-dependent methyltransferase [Nitrospira sp.]